MKRAPIWKIQLNDEEKKQAAEDISAFYLDVRGEEIGIIEQQQLMDLFMEKMAPIVYNRALDDARKWYREQQDNMDSDFYMLYKEK